MKNFMIFDISEKILHIRFIDTVSLSVNNFEYPVRFGCDAGKIDRSGNIMYA